MQVHLHVVVANASRANAMHLVFISILVLFSMLTVYMVLTQVSTVLMSPIDVDVVYDDVLENTKSFGRLEEIIGRPKHPQT